MSNKIILPVIKSHDPMLLALIDCVSKVIVVARTSVAIRPSKAKTFKGIVKL